MRHMNLPRVQGFTFIELMITLAILALLAGMAVPMAQIEVQRGKERDLRIALVEIREAIDAHKRAADLGRIAVKSGESGYPKSLDDLVNGVPDQQSAKREVLYFLRSIPPDPMLVEPGMTHAMGWGKRSYKSPPDKPAEGEDVFDIYSRSEKIGLNGVAYRKW